jgi:hypothetical protein
MERIVGEGQAMAVAVRLARLAMERAVAIGADVTGVADEVAPAAVLRVTPGLDAGSAA